MKTIYRLGVLTICGLLSIANAFAQDTQLIKRVDKYMEENEERKFTIGARFMGDIAHITSEYTPVHPGAAITDARVRTSLTSGDWFFYADFGFAYGKFSQKNIFMRYTLPTEGAYTQSVKAGYFNEPSSMARNTSLADVRFLYRAAPSMALSPGRALGVSYKVYGRRFFADQGIFTGNKYGDYEAGRQNFSVSGRWLFKPINNESSVMHVGLAARYGDVSEGKIENDVVKSNLHISTALENALDRQSTFVSADIPWAKHTIDLGVDLLYMSPKFFVRGEYMYNTVMKDRPDQRLFENQLGGSASWTTLESWQKGNPLRTNHFSGGYLEMGYLFSDHGYKYSDEYSIIMGNKNPKELELVARYSYTNLNDIASGEIYLSGKKKFYPGGEVTDYPSASTSVAGGAVQIATLGVNYSLNKYVKLMGSYSFSHLDNVHYEYDHNFHTFQARLLFSF